MTLNEQISMHKLNLENAIFASKTSRDPKLSPNPGPGEYNTGYEHKYVKNNPQGFGSTTARTYLMNRNMMITPFTDPSHVESPGVGIYSPKKKINIDTESKSLPKKGAVNAIELNNNINAFGTSALKDLNPSSKDVLKSPGPGQYDTNFKDELKILDHKLSSRYKKSPFGAWTNRFDLKGYKEDIKNSKNTMSPDMMKFLEEDTLYHERKKISEMITNQLKQNEVKRPSHMFKSQSSRFHEKAENRNSQYQFQVQIGNEHVYVMEGNIASPLSKFKTKPSNWIEGTFDALDKSRNKSQILVKTITYGTEKMGFSMLSPRFERFNNKYAPGPGEYHTEDFDEEKINLKRSPYKFAKSNKYLS